MTTKNKSISVQLHLDGFKIEIEYFLFSGMNINFMERKENKREIEEESPEDDYYGGR